jgi:hypothetical protein
MLKTDRAPPPKPLLSVLDSLPGHKALMMQDPGKPVPVSSG